MKTAEEIATDIFQDCANGIIDPQRIQDIKDYAQQVGQQVRQDCADNARSNYDCQNFNCKGETVDKQSILSTEIKLP